MTRRLLLWAMAASARGAGTSAGACDCEALRARILKQREELDDWAELGRYREENAELPRPGAGINRVVFLGDSITDSWGREHGEFFPGRPYLNRGISGQTTAQLLIRFRPDVIALQPKAVVVLAGTNDIGGSIGRTSLDATANNYQSMAELADIHRVRVILCTLLPVCDTYEAQTLRRPPEKIRAMNNWIRSFAASKRYELADYYAALADAHQMLRPELTTDGLHPNGNGYRIMLPITERAIERALSRE